MGERQVAAQPARLGRQPLAAGLVPGQRLEEVLDEVLLPQPVHQLVVAQRHPGRGRQGRQHADGVRRPAGPQHGQEPAPVAAHREGQEQRGPGPVGAPQELGQGCHLVGVGATGVDLELVG